MARQTATRVFSTAATLIFTLAFSSLAISQTGYSCANYQFFQLPQSIGGPLLEDMNGNDMIVGTVVDNNTNTARGLLRRRNGTIFTYNVPGAQNTYFYGMNDSGELVGSYDNHGFSRLGVTITTIDYPGAAYT